MKDMLTGHNLQQHIAGPTHKHGHTIHWVISRENDDIQNSSFSSLLSDHHAILFELNLQKPALPHKSVTFCSYKRMDPNTFQSNILPSDLVQHPSESLDELSEQYDKILSDVNNKHAPLVTKTITVRLFTPWHSDEINEAKKVHRKY